jgi:hypothetical protein
MKGSKLQVTDEGFRIKGYGCGIWNSWLRMKGEEFMTTDAEFRMKSYGCRVHN